MESKTETSLDGTLGARLKRLRLAQGMTQSRLGELLGVTFQQVQKYENGSNRISALMLLKLSDALGVPATALLEGLTRDEEQSIDPKPGLTQLVTEFLKLKSPEHRDLVIRLTRTLAETQAEKD